MDSREPSTSSRSQRRSRNAMTSTGTSSSAMTKPNTHTGDTLVRLVLVPSRATRMRKRAMITQTRLRRGGSTSKIPRGRREKEEPPRNHEWRPDGALGNPWKVHCQLSLKSSILNAHLSQYHAGKGQGSDTYPSRPNPHVAAISMYWSSSQAALVGQHLEVAGWVLIGTARMAPINV